MKSTNKEGISLIVLVITIIIMIILATAIILSLANNGIIGNAREAVVASDLATVKNAKALIDSEIEIGKSKGQDVLAGKTYDEYIGERLNQQGIDISKYYFSETSVIVIPKGFVVSKAVGENKVEDGLVIYEGIGEVTDSNVSEEMKNRNQFVWIPVPDMKRFVLTTTYDGKITPPYYEIVEPANEVCIEQYQDSSCVDTKTLVELGDPTQELAEYAAMKASVEKYGGFYIGRYEAADATATESEGADKVNGKLVMQKDKYVYNSMKWGKGMNDATGGAVELARSMYKKNTSVKSTLVYGVQWDAALQFIAKKHPKYPTDSEGKGWSIADNGYEFQKTGYYAVNNIYDMAGNVLEWTMEAYSTYYRMPRDSGTQTDRYNAGGAASERHTTGFRPALYII